MLSLHNLELCHLILHDLVLTFDLTLLELLFVLQITNFLLKFFVLLCELFVLCNYFDVLHVQLLQPFF